MTVGEFLRLYAYDKSDLEGVKILSAHFIGVPKDLRDFFNAEVSGWTVEGGFIKIRIKE